MKDTRTHACADREKTDDRVIEFKLGLFELNKVNSVTCSLSSASASIHIVQPRYCSKRFWNITIFAIVIVQTHIAIHVYMLHAL